MSGSSTAEESSRRYLLRAELEQFYAKQMAMLDDGDAAGWVETFAEDGSFAPPSDVPEVRGRGELRKGTEQTVARLEEAGTVRRHVMTNLNLVSLGEGRAEVVAYVLVVDSSEGSSRITTSTVMRDELVSDGSHWYVARRVVRRDDLPSGQAN